MEKARSRLLPALQSVPEAVEVKVEVRSGKAVENILEVAKKEVQRSLFGIHRYIG